MTAMVDRIFEPLFALVPSPMPAGAMEEVCTRESGGRPRIVTADKVVGGSELGGMQLYVAHRKNGTPKLSDNGGAIGANVDPLDPLGAVYGAQWVYQKAKLSFTAELMELGLPVPPDTFVSAWISLMQFQHSIGTRRGAFRLLMKLGIRRKLRNPIVILDHFARKEMPPPVGRQPSKLVRLRLVRLLGLPRKAAERSPLPFLIDQLSDRPPETPIFNPEKAKRFIVAERERSAAVRPRKSDGSPL